jgi:PAS domain S-box-containing protein
MALLGMPGRLYLAPLPSFDTVPGYRYPRLIAQRTLLVILAGLLVIWISSVARFRSEARMRQHASSLDKLLTRFKAHLASTPLAVLDLDENGLILAFNRAAEDLFGYQATEVLGRSFTLLFPQEQAGGISTLYLNPYRLLTGQQFMAPNITKSGTIVYGQWFNTPIFDGSGHFEGVIAMVENVSEKRRQEVTRHKKMKWESLGVMAGGICHDFNNLLTSILGYIEMARSSASGDQVQWLAKSENAARRAAQLVDLLLAFSGKALGHCESLEIGELMREALGEFRLVLGSKVAFSLNTKPVRLIGDRSQLVEAVRILLRNSLEAVAEQGGRIQVECTTCHLAEADLQRAFSGQGLAEGDYLQLTVIDNGCGIEESRLDLIFDPFYSTKFQGRGLGLSVLFGVLKTHRAGFRVKSSPGKGTSFSLFLPLAEQTGDGTGAEQPGEAVLGSSQPAGPALKEESD